MHHRSGYKSHPEAPKATRTSPFTLTRSPSLTTTPLHRQEGGSPAALHSGQGYRALRARHCRGRRRPPGHAALSLSVLSPLYFSPKPISHPRLFPLSRFAARSSPDVSRAEANEEPDAINRDVPEPYHAASRPRQASAVTCTHSTVPGNLPLLAALYHVRSLVSKYA